MNIKYVSREGFTLIELLVVVIIIAVLAAIAVPQYKHAVLKSRFSTVMPMAKSIADAQEVYYQGRQLYALDVEELDVTPVTAENTSVTLSQTDEHNYVMAQRSDVPGVHYIMYQKYSENYPSEIHCEAEDENADAQWLCGVLSNNNSIGKTITDGYTTYIINGTGAGVVPGIFEEAEDNTNPMSCDKAIAMGFTCTSDETTGVKKICQNGVCRTKTYNEDGSYTSVTCKVDSNDACTSDWKFATYDANGNRLTKRTCSSVDSSGNCTAYSSFDNYDYTYDVNGNLLTQRFCVTIDSNGNCTAYSSSDNYDYTYDANGNRLTQRSCSNVDRSGNCTAYSSTNSYDYTYDANGNKLTERSCIRVDSNGNCNKGSGYAYTYDANGNMLTYRKCTTFTEDGSACATYSSVDNYDYTYDENGNKLTSRICATLTTDGSACATYATYRSNYDYTYDANGNMLTRRDCETLTADGSACATYKSSNQVDYTYDLDGNRTYQKVCSRVDSSGNCMEYSSAKYYMYDDNGKQVAQQSCSGSNLNTSTGECIAYDSTAVQAY